MRGLKTIVILVASLLSCVGTARSAEWSVAHDRNGSSVIRLKGPIVDGDGAAFTEIVTEAAKAGAPVTLLRLDSVGGLVNEGLRIATTVIEGRVATVVDDGALCASSCFLVLAAGRERYSGANARIGVHGASQEHEQTRCARGATISIAQYLKSVGVPFGIIGRMAATPPEELAWLDRSELAGMHVHVLGRSSDLVVPRSGAATPAVFEQSGVTSDKPNDRVWAAAMTNAISTSTQQGGGRLRSTKTCDAQSVCTASVLYVDPKGHPSALIFVADPQGRLVDRRLCAFAGDGQTRTCVDFASGHSSLEVSTPANGWVRAGSR